MQFNKAGPNMFIGCMNKSGYDGRKISITSSLDQACIDFFKNENNNIVHYDEGLYSIINKYSVDFDENAESHYIILLSDKKP